MLGGNDILFVFYASVFQMSLHPCYALLETEQPAYSVCALDLVNVFPISYFFFQSPIPQ